MNCLSNVDFDFGSYIIKNREDGWLRGSYDANSLGSEIIDAIAKDLNLDVEELLAYGQRKFVVDMVTVYPNGEEGHELLYEDIEADVEENMSLLEIVKRRSNNTAVLQWDDERLVESTITLRLTDESNKECWLGEQV